MVCLGNICINTLHKGAKDDDDDDDDDDNNNNNNNLLSGHEKNKAAYQHQNLPCIISVKLLS
jgi:hypothetical protein